MTSKVYLITGANRGIGLSIATLLATDSKNVILATTRDPSKSTTLNALASSGNVHVLTLDVSSQESIDGLDAQLAKYAPDGLDYFISNAGIAKPEASRPVLQTSREFFIEHYTVNALGPLMIAEVAKAHLDKRSTRVFYFVSTGMATMAMVFDMTSAAYPQSKVALNHSVRRLAHELKDEGYTVIAVHPGLVKTDMGNPGIQKIEANFSHIPFMKQLLDSAIEPEESAKCQIELLQKLTKEDNGKFLDYNGEEVPW